jgi:hypothetical protein
MMLNGGREKHTASADVMVASSDFGVLKMAGKCARAVRLGKKGVNLKV